MNVNIKGRYLELETVKTNSTIFSPNPTFAILFCLVPGHFDLAKVGRFARQWGEVLYWKGLLKDLCQF